MQDTVLTRGGRIRFALSTPAIGALVYPGLLLGMYHAARVTSLAAVFEHLFAIVLMLLVVFSVPAFALYQAIGLGKAATQRDTAVSRARIVAHLAYASPALFTFLGVLTYMAGASAVEYLIWVAFWLATVAYIANSSHVSPKPARRAPSWLPAVHGTVAAIVILGFIGLHLTNHLFGLVGPETHIAVMKMLRHWYRSPVVEPLLVALMLFMVASGFVLVRARLTRAADAFGSLQTVTGVYLLLFITGHMNSVFVYQRSFAGKDSDFWFASAGPAGLFGDPWSVRLIPHYALGVWSVVTHAACGLRQILIKHGVSQRAADSMTVSLSAIGALAATGMVSALCRVHLR